MEYNKNDFASGSVFRHLIVLAIPMIIAQLVQMIYNIVDRMYIGHLSVSNSLALTGLGLTFPIITIINAFTNLYGMGGVPLFSIARGGKDEKRASSILCTTFISLLITSFIVTAFFYIFLRPILYSFGASDLSYPYSKNYLLIYLIGTPFLMISTGLNGFIGAQGYSVTGMFTVISGAILNIILDPLFIFTFKLGISGAAIATVISQVFSCLWVLLFFRVKSLYHLSFKRTVYDWKTFREITALGFSGFTFQATNSAVQIACTVTLGTFGGDLYISVITILNSVRDLIIAILSGLANGSQPIIGYNYGAGEYSRVKKTVLYISIIGVLYMLFSWLLLLLFPGQILSMFASDSKLITEGVRASTIYFFGFFMMAFQFAGQSTFQGLGLAKQAIFFSLFRKIVIVVPLTLLLPHLFDLGVDGVYLAEPISNIIGGGCCYCAMLYSLRKLLRTRQKTDKE